MFRSGAASVVAVGVGALLLVAPASAATSHEFTAAFAGSGTNALSGPADVAVDNSAGPSRRYVYVTDPGHHRIEKFNEKGEFILMFGKEVNETAVENSGSTEAEKNICTAASLDTCKAGTSSSTPGAFEAPTFIAVDNSSGNVYVGDTGDNLVSKFDEEGNLIATWGVAGQLEGSPTEPFGPLAGIAVDHLGNLFVYGTDQRMFRFGSSGLFLTSFSTPTERGGAGPPFEVSQNGIAVDSEDDLYKVPIPEVVTKLSEAGNFLEKQACHTNGIETCHLDGEANATGLAVDPATDDLYVDQGGTSISHFEASCPSEGCAPADTFGTPHLNDARGLSIDAASEVVYVADTGENQVAVFSPFVLPTIDLREPTSVEPTSVTLNGHIDPGTGTGTEVTNCRFEYGYDTSYGLGSVPCMPATSFTTATDVSASLPGLVQGTRYHYRLVAENTRGEKLHSADAVVSPAQEPTIEDVTSTDVTATAATLSAKINPNGRETTYQFEYGTTTDYGESSPRTSITENLSTSHSIEFHLEGLQSDLTYHFHLVAQNSEGTNASEDQSFGFYPSPCPNELLRQQTGSGSLPDCRAYELVSPAYAGDVILYPADGPSSDQATDPSRLAFTGGFGLIPNTGEPDNSRGDLYVATRTDEGWVTKYIGLPSTETLLMGGPPWATSNAMAYAGFWQIGVLANSSMSKIVDWNDGYDSTESGQTGAPGSSNAPYVWNSTTGKPIDRWPTDLVSVPGGEEFEGESAASADLSHYVFSSNDVFAPGGVQSAPGVFGGDVYDDNTVADEIAIASRTTEGTPIVGAEPLQVSSEGTRILMSVGGGLCMGRLQRVPLCGAGQLYMRIGDAVTYEIAPGHVVDYLGTTADGSKVYFTSAEELIEGEETDSNTELYMWSAKAAEEGKQPLTLISRPNAGADSTDTCNAAWTEKCDAVPVDPYSGAEAPAGLGGNGRSDSYIASESGDIYFYSPAKLDGQKGIAGGENLYLYRSGQVTFVTTLLHGFECVRVGPVAVECGNGPVTRMEVSADGDHMAFITTSQLTGYDNAGYAEMYSFTPATGRLICDSCIPDGEPPTHNVYGSQNGLFMTNAGRTFFSTEDALVPQDTNKATDVYEFVDGRPRLITTGTGGAPFPEGVIGEQTRPGLIGVSANGTDVYFATTDVLVGQDLNGQVIKIYDARTDGGFPFVPPPPPCAAADECHGPTSSPPPSPDYGAAAPLGPHGNATPDTHSKHHKKKHKSKRAHRKRHAHRGGKK